MLYYQKIGDHTKNLNILTLSNELRKQGFIVIVKCEENQDCDEFSTEFGLEYLYVTNVYIYKS